MPPRRPRATQVPEKPQTASASNPANANEPTAPNSSAEVATSPAAAAAAVGALSKNPPAPPRPVFKNEKAAELYDTLLAQKPSPGDSFTQADLSALGVASHDQELLTICQELVNLGLFQLLTLDGSICYRLKSHDDASKVQSLDKDARIIYSAIEAAGSSGIWTKTLKAKTNLHQTVLTRALKSLESKSYVKQIKNARFPGRKIYMLRNLNPTHEVTGGPFFSDGELDEGLIEYASYFIIMFVRNKSWRQGPRFKKPIKASILHRSLPHMLASEFPNSRILLPHPAGYSDYPTASDILRMLDASGIFENKHFTEADLQILLDVLVFDNKLEVIRPGGRPSRPNPPHSSSAALKRDLDDFDSDADDNDLRVYSKKRRIFGLRGSPSPPPAGHRRSPTREDTPESDADSDPAADTDTMYRSVFRRGPPPPRPESIVISADDNNTASAHPPHAPASHDPPRPNANGQVDQRATIATANEAAAPPPSHQTATDEQSRTAAPADPQAHQGQPKERREHEQIEELLAPSHPYSETPCARCPVFRVCEDGTRVDAKTCEYFPKWLAEDTAGGGGAEGRAVVAGGSA